MSWRKDFRLPYFHLSKISDSLLYHIKISMGASLTADIPETEHKNIEQMLHIRITLMHLDGPHSQTNKFPPFYANLSTWDPPALVVFTSYSNHTVCLKCSSGRMH